MTRTSIGVLLNRGEVQHSWKWVYADNTLPFGLPYEFVEGCSLSFNNIGSNQIGVNGGFIGMPGTHTIAPISLTLAADGAGQVLRWIEGWKSKVKNFKTGLYNGQSAYKRDMKFSMLDTTGNPNVTLRYSGCFPTDTGGLDLNYSESGRLILTQPFAVDDVEIL